MRPALAIVLLTSGLALLSQAGVAIPVAALIAVPLLLIGLVWAVLHFRPRTDETPIPTASLAPGVSR